MSHYRDRPFYNADRAAEKAYRTGDFSGLDRWANGYGFRSHTFGGAREHGYGSFGGFGRFNVNFRGGDIGFNVSGNPLNFFGSLFNRREHHRDDIDYRGARIYRSEPVATSVASAREGHRVERSEVAAIATASGYGVANYGDGVGREGGDPEVEAYQRFLNGVGIDVGTADGDFGKKTLAGSHVLHQVMQHMRYNFDPKAITTKDLAFFNKNEAQISAVVKANAAGVSLAGISGARGAAADPSMPIRTANLRDAADIPNQR